MINNTDATNKRLGKAKLRFEQAKGETTISLCKQSLYQNSIQGICNSTDQKWESATR